MKNIKYIIASMTLMFFVSSCTDFVDPAIPYNGFETGTYLKTIQAPAPLNFFALDNASFSTTLEVHAADKVNNVKQVDIYVAHRRGATVSKEALVSTVPGTSFALGADSQWPRASVKVTFPESISKIGFTKTNIKGGDFLEYRLVLTTTDGKTFSSNNLTGDVSGGVYYASPFFYRVPIICPSALEGTYTSVTTGTSTDDCCPTAATVTSTVTLTKGTVAATYRISDVTAGLYFKFYGVYGITATDTRMAGTISEACGAVIGTVAEPFGTNIVLSGGTVDNATGVIKYNWTNGYDDKGTVTLTPKK